MIRRRETSGRTVLPILTPAGKEKVVEIHEAWQHAQAELTDMLGPDRAEAVRAQMSALRKAVHILEDNDARASANADQTK